MGRCQMEARPRDRARTLPDWVRGSAMFSERQNIVSGTKSLRALCMDLPSTNDAQRGAAGRWLASVS